MRSERSYNSRNVNKCGLIQTLNLALFEVYPFRKYTMAKIVFGTRAEMARESANLDLLDDETNGPVVNLTSPLEVYQHMLKSNFEVPAEVSDAFKRPLSKMTNPREKTIRQLVRKSL